MRINLPGQRLTSLTLPDRASLQREAIRWGYSLRNRERWTAQRDAAARQRDEMRGLAESLGLTSAHFARMAEAGLVEVDIPWSREDEGWELRIFPWEFMLAAATGDQRGGRPFTAVRRLRVAGRPAPRQPSAWLFVLSAPGGLAAQYDFRTEQSLIEQSVTSFSGRFERITDPDEAALAREIAARQPDVVHLSGFDSHQGLALLGVEGDGDARDGYLLRADDGGPRAVDAGPLAVLLMPAGTSPPALIACNLYNSAGRIAPLAVARGARAAIGFQDAFDDELAELFWSTLYRAWPVAGWNLVSAFQFAWQSVREQQRPLQGSGVVLWSDRSIADEARPIEARTAAARHEGIEARWREQLAPPSAESIRDVLEVEVAVIPELNYSILHNNGPLFERFRIRKKDLGIGRVDGLLVNVELHVGTDSYPFRMQTGITETAPHVDLPDGIRISLASELSRALRESVHTSLFVDVAWRDTVLYRHTHRVTLLPVDEWRFDADHYRWLPSFVLPRDPAVLRVVDAAQRYLVALRDDATAGFDGYQCVDAGARSRVTPEDCDLVDLQVRAIWSALLYEEPLSYVNPPPTFTGSSQRLRTPSDCIEGRRGTCIDLALLMAACLEYVEIYPTIFLLKTHAFPAYWRHESFHEQFRVARSDAMEIGGALAEARPSAAPGQRSAWDFQLSQYREILAEVQAGRLVPIETTLVTGRGSFADAVADGVHNLASRREFESMLDILLARTDGRNRVTPLPIRRQDA